MTENLNYGPKLSIGSSEDSTSEININLGSHWKIVNSAKLVPENEQIKRKLELINLNAALERQEERMDTVGKILKNGIANFDSQLESSKNSFEKLLDDWDAVNLKCHRLLKDFEYQQEEFLASGDEIFDEFSDATDLISGVIRCQKYFEKFIKSRNEKIQNLGPMSMMMDDNLMRIDVIHRLLDYNRIDHPPLTVFEHDNCQIHDVIKTIHPMLDTLPMSSQERAHLAKSWLEIEKTAGIGGIEKCRRIFLKIVDVMKSWNVGSEEDVRDLSTALADSKIRLAVEGPKNVIEIGPWSTASNFTSWTDISGGSSIYQSFIPSNLSSVFRSMNDDLESRSEGSEVSEDMGSLDLKTALSMDEVVGALPARSMTKLAMEIANADRTAAQSNSFIISDWLGSPFSLEASESDTQASETSGGERT